MPSETTTASLRELAIQAADDGDREYAEAKAQARLEEMDLCAATAARRAVEALEEIAEGAKWTALDPSSVPPPQRRVTTTTGGER